MQWRTVAISNFNTVYERSEDTDNTKHQHTFNSLSSHHRTNNVLNINDQEAL